MLFMRCWAIIYQKLFIDDFLRNLSGVTMHAKDEELNKIKEIIQKSEWGEKLKEKFLRAIGGTYW